MNVKCPPRIWCRPPTLKTIPNKTAPPLKNGLCSFLKCKIVPWKRAERIGCFVNNWTAGGWFHFALIWNVGALWVLGVRSKTETIHHDMQILNLWIAVTRPRIVRFRFNLVYRVSLITWHPMYHKRSRSGDRGQGHSVNTSSDRQLIALFQ